MYLSLAAFDAGKAISIKLEIENLKKRFPAGGAYVNYSVKEEKLRILRKIYTIEKESHARDFEKFRKNNAFWLFDFALYKVLKVYQEQKAWYEWEEVFRNREANTLRAFQEEHAEEVRFQMWLQWQLFRQFTAAKKYARKNECFLKGDLPILVSRDSADVWTNPEFFKLDFAAGAPPDMYCAKGQRWGMPTYHWEKIQQDDYRYLREKLAYAQNFYDILRIDHVVGLFRFWSIPYAEPMENQGLNGFFDPRDEARWGTLGRKLLEVILKNTTMLLCAEDLGTIPAVCTDSLRELGIPGNEVQRWVKDWNTTHDFIEPDYYRELSVAMLSTHDTANWAGWWENEAGTVDEGLFRRRTSDHRKIGFDNVKARLFDPARSRHGRLRWRESVDSVEKLAEILGKKKEELGDFIDMYLNTYREKEKLWKHLKIAGPMREKSGPEVVRAALKISLASRAVFCINTIVDWLYLTGSFKGEPYQYRTNTPGTVSEKNWSMVLPLSLEKLQEHKVNAEIKSLIASSGRI